MPERGTRISVRTKDTYLCPDKGLVFVSGQITLIPVRTKDSNFCLDKGLVFVSGLRTRISVRTKDSYLCPDKGLAIVRATESCTFRTHNFAEAQMLREVLVLNLGTPD